MATERDTSAKRAKLFISRYTNRRGEERVEIMASAEFMRRLASREPEAMEALLIELTRSLGLEDREQAIRAAERALRLAD